MSLPMTDIHQHLLWGLDDGAPSPEQTRAMLAQGSSQGIAVAAATVHAAPGLTPFDEGLYRERLEEARHLCREEGFGLKLISGAEIAWTWQTVSALRQRKVPTLGDTDYVLLELWSNVSWQAAEDAVNQLTRAGFCPVIAHAERYKAMLLSPRETMAFRSRTGALLQINAASLLKPRGLLQRRFTRHLLREGAIDAVASDAHNCHSRPVNMEQACGWLLRHTDEGYARSLTGFGGRLL